MRLLNTEEYENSYYQCDYISNAMQTYADTRCSVRRLLAAVFS